MNGELWFCQECEDHNREVIVRLDRRLRCEQCGSDAVESLERLHAMQRLASSAISVHGASRWVLGLALVRVAPRPAARGVQTYAKAN